MRGTLDLDQELVDLHARLLLGAVAQQVWQDGLVVGNVDTHRNSDWLAIPVAGGDKEKSIKMIKKRV